MGKRVRPKPGFHSNIPKAARVYVDYDALVFPNRYPLKPLTAMFKSPQSTKQVSTRNVLAQPRLSPNSRPRSPMTSHQPGTAERPGVALWMGF